MSASFDPTPRPALRKAADAAVHPTTQTASPLASASTGDALVEGKVVEMVVRIPKKLRKQVKKAAHDSDLSIDQIVTLALVSELQRRGR